MSQWVVPLDTTIQQLDNQVKLGCSVQTASPQEDKGQTSHWRNVVGKEWKKLGENYKSAYTVYMVCGLWWWEPQFLVWKLDCQQITKDLVLLWRTVFELCIGTCKHHIPGPETSICQQVYIDRNQDTVTCDNTLSRFLINLRCRCFLNASYVRQTINNVMVIHMLI